MHTISSAIRMDRIEALVAERAASVVPAPLAEPPAFLAMPNWTVEETADYCRCQAQTIRKALSLSGTFWGLKPHRFGRRWLFNAAEVRAAVEGR
jgi:hypothetical protein